MPSRSGPGAKAMSTPFSFSIAYRVVGQIFAFLLAIICRNPVRTDPRNGVAAAEDASTRDE